ncbi:DNRLRE domain-containing protein [Brevibacillus halotolerans]|uniref:CBM96 family carbohydrate-binding protein n=1 Tax=Brevibacillus TaxID=55080 RepID=UPI00215BDB07|nr:MULTISPECIES: DNRLRE domain-containing protein [Brevibacillus]MCR8963577.1 DNRLRE domain-containing protein [Brevibacillus laterosporus]MCZ0835733.1 DNRLRE domain-containing protein [Brevibacillus halotolerans]
MSNNNIENIEMDTDQDQVDLYSAISISSALEMSGTVNIIGEKVNDVLSSIKVTCTGTNELLSSISIATENILFGKTEVARIYQECKNSSLYIRSPKDTLESVLAIRDKNKMEAKIEVVGVGTSTIDSALSIIHYGEIASSLGIRSQNKMTSEIAIDGVYRSNLQGSLTIHATDNIKSSMLVRSGNKMYGTATVIPTDDNDLQGTIGVILNHEIPAAVLINRSNKLYGIMDITEQPKQTTELHPVRDAFVSEKVPLLNYGGEQTLVVGLGTARYRSILGFNSSVIPTDHEVESALLRFYITEGREPNTKLRLYATSNDWTEYGVTWMNQRDKQELITDVHTIHTGSITFDITVWLNQQRKLGKTNYSFYVVAENETNQIYYSFFSRESSQKPALELLHHSLTIPSTSRANIDSTLQVKSLLTPNDISATLKVLPPLDTLSTEAAGISLYAWDTTTEDNERVNVYLQTPDGNVRLIKQNWNLKSYGNSTDSDFLDIDLHQGLNVIIYEGVSPGTSGDLTSNIKLLTYGIRDKVGSFPPMLSINKQGKWESLQSNEFQATINRAEQVLDGLEYIDPKPVITWRIIRRPISDIGGSVKVERRKFLDSKIIVSCPNLAGDVHVRKSTGNNLHSSLEVSLKDFDDFDGAIFISQPNLASSMRVKDRSQIDGGIRVMYPIIYEVPSSLLVSKGVMESSIFVTIADKLDMISTLRTQRPIISKCLPSEIFVNRKSLPSSVTIKVVDKIDYHCNISILSSMQKEDYPGILRVTKNSILSSLEVLSLNDINSVLTVRPFHHSILNSNLCVSRSALPSRIDVFQQRIRISNSIKGSIDIWYKNAMECSLRVVSGNLAGQIGVLGYGDPETSSSLTVRIRLKDDIESALDIATVRSYLQSVLTVASYNEALGKVDLIVGIGRDNMPSSLHPSVNHLLVSTLGVRNKNHLEGQIVIGFLRDINLISYIGVFSVDEVVASVIIQQRERRSLPSSINVKRYTTLPCSLVINATDTNGIPFTIIINRKENSNLVSQLNVVRRGNDNVDGSILVGRASNLGATITIKRTHCGNLPAKVEVWYSNKILGEIEVNVKNELPCSIDIETDYGYFFIM